MKNSIFLTLLLAVSFSAGIKGQQPHLGRVVDGYLVNVDEQGVILQGYDAVSFSQPEGAQQGNPQFQTKYHGAIYYFVSAENKAAFEANPTAFEPEYGGYCAYGVSVGHLAPIELWTYDNSYQGRNIFQHNQKAINGWKKDIPANDALAKAQWAAFQKQYVKAGAK